MDLTQNLSRSNQATGAPNILTRLRLTDLKTDLFLAANVVDALITYLALRQETGITEFNTILHSMMDTIGLGNTLILKVVLCVAVLWLLRKTNREHLLVPLSAIFVLVAISNLIVASACGVL